MVGKMTTGLVGSTSQPSRPGQSTVNRNGPQK